VDRYDACFVTVPSGRRCGTVGQMYREQVRRLPRCVESKRQLETLGEQRSKGMGEARATRDDAAASGWWGSVHLRPIEPAFWKTAGKVGLRIAPSPSPGRASLRCRDHRQPG